jgi:two-component system C4-dicarboxylate transport sensor histidine kinase DctB
MGLGLPLSRRLARLLGGELSAANHPEGGAVFTLELPLNDRK